MGALIADIAGTGRLDQIEGGVAGSVNRRGAGDKIVRDDAVHIPVKIPDITLAAVIAGVGIVQPGDIDRRYVMKPVYFLDILRDRHGRLDGSRENRRGKRHCHSGGQAECRQQCGQFLFQENTPLSKFVR